MRMAVGGAGMPGMTPHGRDPGQNRTMRRAAARAALPAVLALALADRTPGWDFETDFSTNSNPDGPWSCRWQSGGTARDGNYGLLTQRSVGTGAEADVQGWWRGDLPVVAKNFSATQTRGAYLPGIAPLESVVHPGNPYLAVVRWTAPRAGTFDLTYRFRDENSGGGDGILWYIDKGAAAGVGEEPAGQHAGDSGEHELARVTIAAGDPLHVVVHPNAGHLWDSTRVKFAVAPSGVAPRDFDLERDFTLASNSDGSRWSYRYKTGTVRDGQYALMTAVDDSGRPGDFMAPFWCNLGSVGRNYGQTGFISGRAVSNGWSMVHPPANSQITVVSWLAPERGKIEIAWRFSDLDPGGGNGVIWAVDRGADTAHGGLTLGAGVLANGGDSGPRAVTNAPVNAGDRIHFVVDPNGSYTYDQTRVSAVIRYVDRKGTAVMVR
jgi:hypothetical protein